MEVMEGVERVEGVGRMKGTKEHGNGVDRIEVNMERIDFRTDLATNAVRHPKRTNEKINAFLL